MRFGEAIKALSEAKNEQVEIEELHNKVESMQKQMRANNLLLREVPVLNNEILQNLIINLGARLETNVTKDDFTCHRMSESNSTPKKKKSSPAILIHFKSIEKREEYFGKYLNLLKHKHFPTLADLGTTPNSEARIYLNTHLSDRTAKLFSAARNAVRKNKLASASASYGGVFVKRTLEGNKFKITTLNQLSKSIKNNS